MDTMIYGVTYWVRIAIVIAMLFGATYNILYRPITFSPIRKKSVFLLLMLYPLLLLLVVWYCKGDIYSYDFNFILECDTYNAAHPVIYALIIKGMVSVFGSPKSVIITQIILMSIACSLMIWFIYRHRLPQIYAMLGPAIAIFGSESDTGFITIAIKDGFYYPFFITLMIGLCSWWLQTNKKDVIIITISLVGVSLFRYDGQVIAIVSILTFLLLVHIRKLSLQHYLGLTCIPLAAMLFCNAFLPAYLQAKTNGMGTKYAMPAELICEAVVHNGEVSTEELTRIEELILPIETIRQFHDSAPEHKGEKYIWSKGSSSFARVLSGKGKELIELLIPIAWRNPGIMLRHLWDQSYMLTHLRDYCSAWFYINILLLILLLIHKKQACLLPFIPIGVNALICIFIATTYESRYAAPIVGGGVVLYLYTHVLLYAMKGKSRFEGEDLSSPKGKEE